MIEPLLYNKGPCIKKDISNHKRMCYIIFIVVLTKWFFKATIFIKMNSAKNLTHLINYY